MTFNSYLYCLFSILEALAALKMNSIGGGGGVYLGDYLTENIGSLFASPDFTTWGKC